MFESADSVLPGIAQQKVQKHIVKCKNMNLQMNLQIHLQIRFESADSSADTL